MARCLTVSRLITLFPVRLSIFHSPDGFLRDDSDSRTSVCPALHLTRQSITLDPFSIRNPTWGDDLVSFVQNYINPFSSGSSALRIDWMEYIGMSELMPGSPQLVDLDGLHHVTSAAPLLLTAILNQSNSGCAAVLKRRSLAEGVLLAAHVDKEAALLNAPMLTHRSGRSQALDLRGFEKSRRHNLPEFRSAMRT